MLQRMKRGISRDKEEQIAFRRTVRGTFLEYMAKIDNLISGIIPIHFYQQDEPLRFEFAELFVNDRVQLGRKIELLTSILKTNYPDLLRREPKLVVRLRALNEFRTKLAHGVDAWVVESSKSKNRKSPFVLLVYRKGRLRQEVISDTLIAEMERHAEYVIGALAEIFIVVKQRPR